MRGTLKPSAFLPMLLPLFVLSIACSSDGSSSQVEQRESSYLASVDQVLNRFFDHRGNYNDELERIGASMRNATNERSHRIALTQAVSQLEQSAALFRQDKDDFLKIMPPPRFQEFHLLMTSAMNDIFGATESFVTFYSLVLNSGAQDTLLASRASELLRKAGQSRLNGNLKFV